MIQVKNMISKSGNSIANQFIIRTKKGRYFQSYDSIIAFIPNTDSKIQLDKNFWDYSRTTAKYRNMFLGESSRETIQNIEEKNYLLKDLNK